MGVGDCRRPFRNLESADDIDIVFHDTDEPYAFTIEDRITNGTDFGGIFAGPSGGMSGEYRHAVVLDSDKVMDHADLLGADDNQVDAAIKDAAPYMTAEQREESVQYITEDENVFDADEDSVTDLFNATDLGEASHEAQYIRGQVARSLGYQAARMYDETGTSTLVMPGITTYPLRTDENTSQAGARIYDEWKEYKARANQPESRPFYRSDEDLMRSTETNSPVSHPDHG